VAFITLQRWEAGRLSPTVFTEKGYRFLFFSREETPVQVHVQCLHAEAKFWLEPRIELARNVGLTKRELRVVQSIIEEHADGIIRAWRRHCAG